MRKLILNVAVSLDGLIEGPNGEYDWCFTDQDYGMNEFLKGVDAVFYGRKSYELMLKVKDEFSFTHIPGYVFSNTLKSVEKEYKLVSGDVLSWVSAQKKLDGRNIWLFGGSQLTTSLVNANLLDEMLLAIHPIILGEGKPLFSDISNRVKLDLLDSKVYDSGLVSMRYSFNKGQS